MRISSPPKIPEPTSIPLMVKQAQAAEWAEDFATAWPLLDAITQAIPCPTPSADLWDGTPLAAGDVLYVWKRFRDIGADIRQASMLADLEALPETHVIVETDPRLIPLFERSFPRLDYVSRVPAERPNRTLTCHATHERLGSIFRSHASDFPPHPGFLVPSAGRVALARRLRPRDGRRLIGFSWASTNTSKSLPTLDDWLPVLRANAASFVSLQYGDVEDDLAYLREAGIDIKTDPTLDALNDLDGLAAAIAACDSVLTISNTTAHLAGAVGTPTMIVLRDAPMLTWPRGRNRTAWYPAVRLAWCPAAVAWQAWMKEFASNFQRLSRAA